MRLGRGPTPRGDDATLKPRACPRRGAKNVRVRALTESRELLPLCVDLDGTLIEADILARSLLLACRSRTALFALPGLLWSGKAALKAGLARLCPVACEHLPYDHDLVAFLRQRKAAGQPLILATGTNVTIASRINEHLGGLFDEVMGSDEQCNLRGDHKARALVDRFGERGFVYIGNDATDLKVWSHAASAMIIGASKSLSRRAGRVCVIEHIFTHRRSLVARLSVRNARALP